jgi:hypothetical protein
VLGIALVSLPTVLAISWAIQHRFLGRYLACLAAGLAGGAALAALFAVIGERATYDPHASSTIGNWSGMVGAVVGLVAGWIAGTVTGPAVLLRLLRIRLDGGRLILAILTGIALSALLVYLLEFFNPRGSTMSFVAGLSSAATFAALTMAARDRSA